MLNQDVINGLLKCMVTTQGKKDKFCAKYAGQENLSSKREWRRIYEKIDIFQATEEQIGMYDLSTHDCFIKLSNFRVPPQESMEIPPTGLPEPSVVHHSRDETPQPSQPVSQISLNPSASNLFDFGSIESQVIQIPNQTETSLLMIFHAEAIYTQSWEEILKLNAARAHRAIHD